MWNIVLVGVGGTGMSWLAWVLSELDLPHLLWIDSTASELTDSLQRKWMNIVLWHGIYQVQADDFVIYSAAAGSSPEVLHAQKYAFANHKKPRPPMLYHQFLGELSKRLSTIAITWSHGKSTTTALTSYLFSQLDDSCAVSIVWASVNDRWGNNYFVHPQRKQLLQRIIYAIIDPKSPPPLTDIKTARFIIEADEYNKHFLLYDPDYALITNIELDHIDIYWDSLTYQKTFEQFLQKVKHRAYICEGALWTEYLRHSKLKEKIARISAQQFNFQTLLWWHNHVNASLAQAVWYDLIQASQEDIQHTLERFSWLRRRCEHVWESSQWVPIYSDYAHHPTEIASTISMLRETFPSKRLSCIFQPHQLQRLLSFHDEFLEALQLCDRLLLYSIYAARENVTQLLKEYNLDHLTSADDVGNYFAKKLACSYTRSFSEVTERIETRDHEYLVLFTAGDLDYLVRKRVHTQTT